MFLRWGDRLSRRWLVRAGNAYVEEVDETGRRIGAPGARFLNLSHEWSCTAAVGAGRLDVQGSEADGLASWARESEHRNYAMCHVRRPDHRPRR